MDLTGSNAALQQLEQVAREKILAGQCPSRSNGQNTQVKDTRTEKGRDFGSRPRPRLARQTGIVSEAFGGGLDRRLAE
jgi:hypothetical protein